MQETTYMSEGLRTVSLAQDFTAVTKDPNVRQIVVKDVGQVQIISNNA